ncbi:MAG: DNA internalization-related competence protein ComEC/Rec2 [Trueperaceae bacterium]
MTHEPEVGSGATDAAPFVPWPLPAALGMALGIVAVELAPAAWAIAAGVVAAGALLAAGTAGARFAAAGTAGARLTGAGLTGAGLTGAGLTGAGLTGAGFTGAGRARWAAPPWVVVLVVAALVGAVRYGAWLQAARADPVAALVGRSTRWRGTSDGDVLVAHEPVPARLALVATGDLRAADGASLPTGEVTFEGVVEPAAGKRNPGGFDYAAYLRRRGVSGQLFVERVVTAGSGVRLRERLLAGVRRGLPEQTAALMAAMTLGERGDLGALRERFAAAGLAHVLALSGLHVGVLLAAIGRALAPLGRRRYPALMLVTVGFVALVGPSPSVMRAATMALAVLVGLAFGSGRVEPWTALALAATVGLLHAPQMLFDASFQLSYLAVAGMLVFLPPWAARFSAAGLAPSPSRRQEGRPPFWPRVRHAAVVGGAASVAAQLPSLSLVAGSFGAVPVFSAVVNVVAVPLAGLLVPMGFLAGVAGLVALPLASWVNRATAVTAEALLAVAAIGERLPSLAWGEVGWLGHACWGATVVALAAWAHGLLRARHALTVALVAGATTWAVPARWAPPDIWYLDVGQGDAVLLRLPGGGRVLIDGGGTPFSDYDVGARVVLPALRALGVHRLDLVVATHPDADHVEGLLPVLEHLPVGMLVTGPAAPGVRLDEQLRALAQARGVPVHQALRGERIHVGKRAGRRGELQGDRREGLREGRWASDAVLEVVNPGADAAARVVSAPNETSVALVLWLEGSPRTVFLGDLGIDTETRLAVPPLDVLMVGHHGSRGSTSEALVRAVGPRLAVVSVGRNRYGHPHPTVIERLAAHGAKVLTTLEHGAVRVGLGRRGPRVVTAAHGSLTWDW